MTNPYQCEICGGRYTEEECPVCVDSKKEKKSAEKRKK